MLIAGKQAERHNGVQLRVPGICQKGCPRDQRPFLRG